MPRYKITDPETKKSLIISGDAPPTQEDATAIFASRRKSTPFYPPEPITPLRIDTRAAYERGEIKPEIGVEEPGILGTLLNPAEVATMIATGGISAARLGRPILKAMADWGLYGAPSIAKGIRGGVRGLIGGLGAKAVERRIPPAMTVPTRIPTPMPTPSITELAKQAVTPRPTPAYQPPYRDPVTGRMVKDPTRAVQSALTGREEGLAGLKVELIDGSIHDVNLVSPSTNQGVFLADGNFAAYNTVNKVIAPSGKALWTKVEPSLTELAQRSQLPRRPPPIIPPPPPPFLRSGEELLRARGRHLAKPPTIVPTKPPTISLAGMGKAISDNLYQGMWDRLQRTGRASPFAKAPPFEAQVEALYKQGKIKSVEDIKNLVKPIRPVTTLTESEKLATRAIPPAPSELTPQEIEFLKKPTVPLRETKKAGRLAPVRAGVKGVMEEFASPYTVLSKDPSGKGLQLWRMTDQADRQAAVEARQFVQEFQQNIKFKIGSEESKTVGRLLDTYETFEEIPEEVRRGLSPQLQKAFQWARGRWNQFADTLMQKGHLHPDKKIRTYLYRVFPKDQLRTAWGEEVDIINSLLARVEEGSKRAGLLKSRLSRLEGAIDTYDKTGTVLYDVLPKHIDVPFLKPRRGREGYSLDMVDAMLKYHYYYTKKIFKEPVLKQAQALMSGMERDQIPYARWYLRRWAELEKEWRGRPLERALTTLEYLKDMGFNFRSAITNATQHLNTIVEIGPRWTARGAQHAFTDEGRRIWDASGHAIDVPGLYWGQISKGFRGAQNYVSWVFNQVELGNRKVAYLGGYLKAIRAGRTPEQATIYADRVLRRTQFLYGPTGMPRAFSRPGGALGLQFTTFTIKELELLSSWARHHPQKLLAYSMLAYGGQESLKQYFGIDLSSALGLGIDMRQMTQALYHLGAGEPEAARIHFRLGLPRTPFTSTGLGGGGIFPSGLAPAISTMKNVVGLGYDLALTGRIDPERLLRLEPVQLKRFREAGTAITEGVIATPERRRGVTLPPRVGYPIRGAKGELRAVETPYELGVRTFIGRPYVETRGTEEVMKEKVTEDVRREKMRDIIELRKQGREDEARELEGQFGRPSKPMIEAEKERRMLTPQQRAIIKKRRSKVGRSFRERIGETEEGE